MKLKQAAIQEQIHFIEGLILGLVRDMHALAPAPTPLLHSITMDKRHIISAAFNTSVAPFHSKAIKDELKRLERILDTLKDCHTSLEAEAA